MTKYEALINQATELRVNHRPKPAIRKYKRARAIGGPRDREISQMIGVSYKMRRKYALALVWYYQSLQGASTYETGNIKRDIAEVYSRLKENDHAIELLSQSLVVLTYESYPEENGITVGFLARVELRQGDLEAAMLHFAEADAKLEQGSNRHFELYNKLYYAHALSRCGQREEAVAVAEKALQLAATYGSWKHCLRAKVLLRFGYLGDILLGHR